MEILIHKLILSMTLSHVFKNLVIKNSNKGNSTQLEKYIKNIFATY